jgi:iron complex outermembrane receptor protein
MIKFYLSLSRYLTVFLVCISSLGFAQQITVSGKVTSSDDGAPLPGANVLEKGTNNGTSTDANGEFKINVGSNAILSISFVGYKTQDVGVGSRTTIDVVLETDLSSLSEVVVIGYGEVQKKDATGAVAAISNKDFNKGVLTSPQDLILGKMAGVSVSSNTGAPGDNSTIRIRGGSSLSASNDPLIVIDGFPVDNTVPGFVANPLASINPSDIETFTILKDASATAIYGSRASNGVIIITTKKGAVGKPVVNYSGTVSASSAIKYVDVLNGNEYRTMVNNLETTGVSGIDAAAVAKLGTANTNWQKEIFRTAISTDHNINVSGSVNKNFPYRVSYGFTDQEGILKTSNSIRNSLNVNLNPTLLNGDLKLNISAKGSHTVINFADAGAVGAAVTFDPTQPVYAASGDIADPNKYGGYFSWLSQGVTNGTSNPVALLKQTHNVGNSNRIITNAQAEYNVKYVPGLKLNLNIGLDKTTSDGYNKVDPTAAFAHANSSTTLIGRQNTSWGRNQSELFDFFANYGRTMGDHKFDVTAGYGYQHFYREGSNTTASTASTKTVPFKNENFLVSFFGRLNYSYKGKYLLTATLRDDGSSRFSSKNRWGLFPSIAAAWRMKDEKFFSDINVLSDLKLRAGYGVTGQQDVLNYYPYIATYQASDNLTQYQLGNVFYTTLRPNPYDANIKWESTATTNVGVDFGFFGDKLSGSVEVFQKDTKDLLNYIAIPNGVNFSNYLTTNVGNMTNKGLEITLKGVPISTGDFTWNAGMNFTAITSKVTRLTLTNDPSYTGYYHGGIGVNANIQNDQVGFPVNSFYAYQQVYDAAGKPVEGLYVDRSGQGGVVSANEANKYHYKKPAPDFLIGINSRLNYKKFDFSFSGRLSIGNYVYNNVASARAFYNGVYQLQYFSNVHRSIFDTNFVTQQQYSDYYIQNASFFKMDNLSLGYTFDQVMASKVKARLSFTVQNAFIITKYKGIDPEVTGSSSSSLGIDNNLYPRPRTFLVNLNVTF